MVPGMGLKREVRLKECTEESAGGLKAAAG